MNKAALLTLLFLLGQILNARENPFAPVERFGGEPLTKPLPAPEFTKEPTPVPVIEETTCVAAEKNTTIHHEEPLPQKITPVVKREKPILFTPKSVPHKKRVHTKIKHKKRAVKVLTRQKYTLLYSDANLKLYARGKTLKVITKDSISRHFKLKAPTRLVLNFENDFLFYDSIYKPLKNRYVKALKLGTHHQFYRLTLILSKDYRYRLKHYAGGYLITFF